MNNLFNVCLNSYACRRPMTVNNKWIHNLLYVFSCILLTSNSMIAIWKNIHSWVFQRLQISLVLRTHAILIVFEKLTRACFFQIALETICTITYTKFFFSRFVGVFSRYGVDEPRISHSLVKFAGNLPDSFDPIAKRKLFSPGCSIVD